MGRTQVGVPTYYTPLLQGLVLRKSLQEAYKSCEFCTSAYTVSRPASQLCHACQLQWGRRRLPMQNLERLSDRHRAYLLYCWADSTADPPQSPTWRFAITRVPCRERRQGLASLSELVAFLRNELYSADKFISDPLEYEGGDGNRTDPAPSTQRGSSTSSN